MAGLDDLVGDSGSLSTPDAGGGAGGGFTTNKDLMADARSALSGNWGMAILGTVLYLLLVNSLNFFSFSTSAFVSAAASVGNGDGAAGAEAIEAICSIVLILLSGPFLVGFNAFFLGIASESDPRLENLFVGFKRFGAALGAYLLFVLFMYLWLLLFIIPGIIAAFRYSMAFFILADDEECGPLEAIRRSKEMMRGNKWKFFCLHWRFLGWYLLSLISLGIGFLWLIPYMQTSFAKFYEDVK